MSNPEVVKLVVVAASLIALITFFVSVRFFVRSVLLRSVDWDDALLLIPRHCIEDRDDCGLCLYRDAVTSARAWLGIGTSYHNDDDLNDLAAGIATLAILDTVIVSMSQSQQKKPPTTASNEDIHRETGPALTRAYCSWLLVAPDTMFRDLFRMTKPVFRSLCQWLRHHTTLRDTRHHDVEQKVMSHDRSLTRTVVEHVFGRCKRKFKIIRSSAPEYAFEDQVQIVYAVTGLYNFIQLEGKEPDGTEEEEGLTDWDFDALAAARERADRVISGQTGIHM
ncbi:hypothetical protein EDB80DRAFT_882717 [Ilyonectria destructans]|nr:hypothetical protein EDB80DRAFT_882717 [Ilyonectria destructans]